MELQPSGVDAPPETPLATPPTAPPVVAVVVARDPGEWFEEALRALVAQDYPNLSLLVVDAGAEVVHSRVADAAPEAFVRRLERDPGFGAAANEVLEVVEGAAFFLFCHDDIAPEPDAVRLLVGEAFRSNAAVVGPKLVEWDSPRRLLQIGQGMDRAGYGVPLVERGELDQSQHDSVRDVFTVPGPCTLVRADLFDRIGGFDEEISDFLDDVSLCWRAQIAGARVIVAPAARVRHRDELARRAGHDQRRRLQARHRLRIVLTCYRPLTLIWALVQTLVLNVFEVAYALIAGRRKRAGDVVSAWIWNLQRVGSVREARRHVRTFRHVPDRELRRSMAAGSARLSQLLRGQIGGGDDRLTGLARSGRDAAGVLRSGALRDSAIVWALVALVLAAGSRHLLTRGIPAVGELVSFGDSPAELFRNWVSGWRTSGLGSESPAPSALGLLSLLGVVAGGAMGILRIVLTLGMIPLGALFAYRLPAATGSRRAQIACLLVYVTIPLPYDALARGRWGALVFYAAAPLVVTLLARASGTAPLGSLDAGRTAGAYVLALGLITALVAAVIPVAVAMVPAMAVALALGGLIAVTTRGSARMVAVSLPGAGLAVLMHLPWSFDFVLPGTTLSSFTGLSGSGGSSDLGALLRFDVGPLGSAPFGWSFLLAASLPLLIARAERHAWAVRSWTMAVVFFALAWAAQRGTFPVALPAVEVLLVPAAVGLALSVAMGMAAFETDLPSYRFGWRQAASALAAAAVAIGALPLLGASFDGRWSMPSGDHARALAFIDQERDEAPFRVLWLGDPEALPLGGWELTDDVAYATTVSGAPTPVDLWVGSDSGRTGLLGDAIDLARSGQTARLGRLLGPMGVRYVVVPERLAPAPFATGSLPIPGQLTATLAAQLDLEPLDVPAGLSVYRNQAFVPPRAAVPAAAEIPTEGGIASALGQDLSAAAAVLPERNGHLSWSGPVDPATTVLLSASHSGGWRMDVDGESVEVIKPFGWSTGFEVVDGGQASLSFETSPLRYGLLGIQVLGWLWVLRALSRRRLTRAGRQNTGGSG